MTSDARGVIYLAVAALILAALLLAMPSEASARPWTAEHTRRVARHAETIRTVASMYGVDPALLAALAVHETGMRPLRGGRGRGMYGPCQVSWAVWADDLEAEGIALEPDDLLESGLVAGLLAGAYVLAWIRDRYPDAERWRVLCLYSAGTVAEEYQESCPYADSVLRALPRARVALAAGVAVGAKFGAGPGE